MPPEFFGDYQDLRVQTESWHFSGPAPRHFTGIFGDCCPGVQAKTSLCAKCPYYLLLYMPSVSLLFTALWRLTHFVDHLPEVARGGVHACLALLVSDLCGAEDGHTDLYSQA